MEIQNNDSILNVTQTYLSYNYDYLYLSTMVDKGINTVKENSTLITGSSHALNGIWTPVWDNAINCSMHSQDIFYDYVCARKVIGSNPGRFNKCFIIMGYYIPYQDLSLSKWSRESLVPYIYYPVYKEAHNWEEARLEDLWRRLPDYEIIPDEIKEISEKACRNILSEYTDYYNDLRKRTPYYDLGGVKWYELDEDVKKELGKKRAIEHNATYEYKLSYEENKKILNDYVDFMYENSIKPIVVITPFTKQYNEYVDDRMKKGVIDMLDSLDKDIDFIDFNNEPGFTDEDFTDTDHLNEIGAVKMSYYLTEIFGK